MFSGGTYPEVARWLWNFLTAHAKRVDPRFEVELHADDEREGKSYGARLSFQRHFGPMMEFEFREVADQRGSLAWCAALAEHIGELKAAPEAPVASDTRKQIGDLCKECGQATFVYEEGCKKCLSCGFNEC